MTTSILRVHRGLRPARLVVLLLCLVFSACTTVRIIADYDDVIDKGVTDLQVAAETFFVKLDHTGRKPGPLTKEERDFLDKTSVAITSLQIRAAAHPKNGITTEQLSLLRDSFSVLGDLLKEGVTKEQVQPIRNAFNTSTAAILKLELAKKRGESPAK